MNIYSLLILRKILASPRLICGNILESEDRFMYTTELKLEKRINELQLELKQLEKTPQKNKIESVPVPVPRYLEYLYS